MEDIIFRLTRWADGEKQGPSIVEFGMIDGCNQRCRFCDFPECSKINCRITDNDYYRFIREAAELKVDEIRFCGGGDPLFKKDRTMKMISLIKKYGMRCAITTNGTLFTERDIKNLVELGMDYIEFSIHGPDAATHDYLVRLPGAFDKVVHNIRRFNYWKQKLKKDKPNLMMASVINNINYDKLDRMILLAKEFNLTFLNFFDLDMRSEGCKKLKLNETQTNELSKNFKKLEDLAKNSNINLCVHETVFHKSDRQKNKIFNLNIDKSKHDLLNVPCYEPWYLLAIYGGKVLLCHNMGEKFDNVLVGKRTLKQIWYGKEMKEIREKVMKKEISGNCQFCCYLTVTPNLRNELRNISLKGDIVSYG